MSLTESLTQLIGSRPISDADRGRAERYVRDWLGSMVAGTATEPGHALRSYGAHATDLEGRVFLAAALSHITETDDLHRRSTTHPGCVVVPVALLLGERERATGWPVLRAVLAGYEAMLRVGEALGPGHYETFHNTATAGVFGAAAAAASLLELSDEQWVWAFGNAGTQASGLWQFNEDATMSKHLHAGHAATAGLRAALLAREGFTGPASILEGDRGFFRGFCPDPDIDAVLRDSAGWKLGETSLKPYPSCRHTHPAIDAALELRGLLGPDVGARLRDALVTIDTYPAALALTDNARPETPYAAKFSLQFCVATALANGNPGLGAFSPEALSEPGVRALTERTTVRTDALLAEAYPVRWGATVEVAPAGCSPCRTGRTTARGDPEDPLTEADLDAKVSGLLAHGGLAVGEIEAVLADSKGLTEDGPPGRLRGLLLAGR